MVRTVLLATIAQRQPCRHTRLQTSGQLAKAEAHRVVEDKAPEITAPERERIMQHLKQHWQRRYGLVEVG